MIFNSVAVEDIRNAPIEQRADLFRKLNRLFTSKEDITSIGYFLLGYLPRGRNKREKYNFILKELVEFSSQDIENQLQGGLINKVSSG